jgi:quercetin dioxygenase-like cupin family protein
MQGERTPADAVSCPPAGTRIEVVERAAETDGERVRVALTMDPPADSHGPYQHVHPEQDETLEVVSGRMGVQVDGEEHVLEAGDSIDIERGVPHRYWNEGPGELRAFGEVRPGLETDALWPLLFELASERPASKVGFPLNPFLLSVVFDRYPDHIYMAGVPVALQKWTIALVANLGYLLGYSLTGDGSVGSTYERICPVRFGLTMWERLIPTEHA